MHLIDYQIEAVTGLRQRQCLAAEGELAQIDAIRPALRSDAVKNRLRLVDGEVKTGIGNIDGNLLGSDLPIRNCQRFGASRRVPPSDSFGCASSMRIPAVANSREGAASRASVVTLMSSVCAGSA